MGEASPASSAADADEDPDLAALEDLLGPRKDGEAAGHANGHASASAGTDTANAPETEAGQGRDPADPGADAGTAEGPSTSESRGAAGGPQAEPQAARPRSVGEAPTGVRGAGTVVEAERLPSIATLHPMEPGMGLAEALRRDRFVTVPVRPWPRWAAVAAAGIGAMLWVLALRAAARGAPWPAFGLSAPWWSFLLMVAGIAGYFVVVRTWPERQLRLPMAPSQEQQFDRIQAQVDLLRRSIVWGLATAGAGILVLALSFRFFPVGFLLGVGSLLLAAGTVAAVAAAARWGPTRVLYVQTLVLQRLEGMGLGRELALDPRTADVILALDRLLGQLPESSLRQFLSQPEAQWYLDLIRKLKGGRGAE